MTKIDREKIVRAVVGSASLEGYQGSLKEMAAKEEGWGITNGDKTQSHR